MIAPVDLVLLRLVNPRKAPRGYTALCPGHPDRTASLSVRVCEDGKVLLHCFRGCDFASITAALNIDPRDLFPRDKSSEWRTRAGHATTRRAFRESPAATVQAYIERELPRLRAARRERNAYDTPHYRSSDVNEARSRANAIFDLKLEPIARYEWEGFAPHDCDPAWPGLFEIASSRVGAEMPDASKAARVVAASDLAAGWLHDLARLPAELRGAA